MTIVNKITKFWNNLNPETKRYLISTNDTFWAVFGFTFLTLIISALESGASINGPLIVSALVASGSAGIRIVLKTFREKLTQNK